MVLGVPILKHFRVVCLINTHPAVHEMALFTDFQDVGHYDLFVHLSPVVQN